MLIFSLTIILCEMLLSMSGKLCLRHFLRIHVLLYKCIVHVCFVYHVCVRVVNMETCKQTCKQSRSNESMNLPTCLCDTRYVLAWERWGSDTGMLACCQG